MFCLEVKRHSCPVGHRTAAVGAIRVANKSGGMNKLTVKVGMESPKTVKLPPHRSCLCADSCG